MAEQPPLSKEELDRLGLVGWDYYEYLCASTTG